MKNYTINGFERKVGLCIMLLVISGLGLNACKKEQNAVTPDCTDYTLTQADLDKASEFNVKSGIIGDTFDSLFFKSHDTMTTKYLSRDVFENLIARNDSVGTGAIYVRRSYAIPDTNHRDQRTLTKVMLMIKHCSGYFPDGGDWEYVNMKIDASVDTS
ncbi:MAG: hypothetical protein Q8919_15180, partial [Bacteroidota bacterium]|nr:hypothetical protein [Bacteroidota bacterium]